MSHLALPNDNSHAPHLFKSVRRLDKTRFVLLNEYGKLVDLIECKEATEAEAEAVSRAYMKAVQAVIKAGRRWEQPDWVAIRAKALADLASAQQVKSPKAGPAA